jgi:hypothetical protein
VAIPPANRTFAAASDDRHLHRYEDNFDPVTNLTVMVMNTDKSSVTGWGSPQKFLDQHRYLLGEQVFVGETHPACPACTPARSHCATLHCCACIWRLILQR